MLPDELLDFLPTSTKMIIKSRPCGTRELSLTIRVNNLDYPITFTDTWNNSTNDLTCFKMEYAFKKTSYEAQKTLAEKEK